MTVETFRDFLKAMREYNVMSAKLVAGGEEIAVTMGPEFPGESTPAADPIPGGWKSEVSDPLDPDPLGLGQLDAPLAFDDDEVTP